MTWSHGTDESAFFIKKSLDGRTERMTDSQINRYVDGHVDKQSDGHLH